MRRLAILALLAFAACSNGIPVVPAGFRGSVSVVPFMGRIPGSPDLGLVPLLAVASFRGDEIRLVNPASDVPIAGPNPAWALAIPTLARPSFLGSASLHDGQADLLVVAGAEPRIQVVGTWLDGTNGYGVVATLDLADVVGPGAQILSLAVAAVPSGAPVGSPPIAPATPGKAWVVLGATDPADTASGQLVVLEMARQPDGSIALSAPVAVMALGFTPIAVAAAPDNVHLYLASVDVIRDSTGRNVLGIAEIDASGGLPGPWPVRGFDARGAPTYTVAAAFVGERIRQNFYTFSEPALRVYAALDTSGCGPERSIACGFATFDPALGGLATDPAPPGPPGSTVPTQTYRTPLLVGSLPIAMGIALPATVPASEGPGQAFGSQVCYSPATPGISLPLCPGVTEEATTPPFNANGVGQPFMLLAPTTGQLWTSVTALATAIDGLAYVQDLGRFGPVNSVSMFNSDTSGTGTANAAPVGPAGPLENSAFFGFPPGTAALGLWQDQKTVPSVVYLPADLPAAVTVWPGFTRDDRWLVSYQGLLPGLQARRAVVGLSADGSLYMAIQDAAVPSPDGVLPAASYWVPGAYVSRPELGVHTVERDGSPGDLGLFLLDVDPCPSTRPNWIPAGATTPVFDPTKPPEAHEAVVLSFLGEDPFLYPGGALRLAPASDAAMAAEYQCLVSWFQQPGHADKVLTAFANTPTTNDYIRGGWVRAGSFLLVGQAAGYAGRPQLDVQYDLAWAEEDGLSGEALLLARKARRFYYPSAYPARGYSGFPGMTDPMQPGPAVGLRLGRYCPAGVVTDCDPLTSPPARDAGVTFTTRSGVFPMSRHPSGTAGGNWVTSFDKSIIPGQEYRGRVFYSTFVGDLLMMIPPGLDAGQTVSIR